MSRVVELDPFATIDKEKIK